VIPPDARIKAIVCSKCLDELVQELKRSGASPSSSSSSSPASGPLLR
jgi:hypothetical protein